MRIAQVSDPHLGLAAGPRDPAARLAAVMARIAALYPLPDRVIFTGDLAETAAPEEYAAFRAAVAGFPVPMAAVPGNHDRRDGFLAGLAGSGVATGALPFLDLALDAGALRLLCLDTLDEGLASGLLCAARLERIAAALAADDRPALVFMHHPPFRVGQPHADASNCRGGDRLAALAAGRLAGVACGHGHLAIDRAWAGAPASVCPAVSWEAALDTPLERPFRLMPQRPGFRLHDWRPELGLVSTAVFLEGDP